MYEFDRKSVVVPVTKVDKLLDNISKAIVAIIIFLIAGFWFRLPGTIPTHFNVFGEADGYGSKYMLVVQLVLVFGIYAAFSYQIKRPDSYSYIVTITPNNALPQFTLLTKFLRILKIEVLFVFLYLTVSQIFSSAMQKAGVGLWFIPTVLLVIFGSLGVYGYKSSKLK